MTRMIAMTLVAAAALVCVGLGEAGSVGGPFGRYVKIGADQTLTLNQAEHKDLVKFRGGQRACVIVLGDHKPIVPVTIEVFDDKGRLVAQDNPAKGVASRDAKGNDLAA